MAAPIVFRPAHRIQFSDLDPYNHVSTAEYARYYIDHRMQGLRDYIGWDTTAILAVPFMVFIKRIEIDYVRPVQANQEITITSFVREFGGKDAFIECTMVDASGTVVSRCNMTATYIEKATGRAADWPPDRIA